MTDHLGPTGLTTRSIRTRNRRLVLDLLREQGVLSQADIARRTGLSRTTVSTLVSELRSLGIITEAESGPGGAGAQGRPPILITLDDSAGAAVGIDLGLDHVRVAVANLAHVVLCELVRELEADASAEQALDVIAAMVSDALDEAGIERPRVIGVGMGLPAPVDRARGTVASTAVLPAWRSLPVADQVRARLDLPVELDNEANLGALAETAWGAAQGCAQVVYLRVSSTIGCGLILDGWLFRGAHGLAGEVGHTVVNEAGLVCQCGSRGCLETVAGADAVADLLRRSHGEHVTLAQVVKLAMAGDAGCERALGDISRQIGIAVANLCNVLDPERVVIGGTLARGGELVLRPIRDAVRGARRQFTTEPAEVVPGVLGDRAVVLGALALVMRDASKRFSLRLGAG